MTTIQMIRDWFNQAPKGTTHMIIVCDTFEYEEYPVYIKQDQNIQEELLKRDGVNMQKVMEVYKTDKPFDQQQNSDGKLTFNL